ncbi:MAG: carboxypeptidase-like regulatory domain-containing protein [Acidobacteriaceae bacterium]
MSAVTAAVAQEISAPAPQTGTIIGTVIDVNGIIVSGATVVLEGPSLSDPRTVVTNDNGFFELHDLKPGTPYQIIASAKGFANRVLPVIVLKPGQYLDLSSIRLQVAEVVTTVHAAYSTEQIATEQVRVEEKQRVLGIIPNFYVVYDPNVVPLTTKLKFSLALKVATDPITFIGAGFLAGIYQAADTPDYVEGAKGYGQRIGAVYAGGFTDIMIGGAILPSVLHQDPRYFYQGTGTKKSRAFHAISSAFICKGDNGQWQPNYSTVGGDLASAAISNIYYPAANRGAGLVFENTLINTADRMAANLAQEFILRKFTTKPKKKN